MHKKRWSGAKGPSVEFEYDWGDFLRLTLIRGAVPGDLVRIEALEKAGRRTRIDLPLRALPRLREALVRVNIERRRGSDEPAADYGRASARGPRAPMTKRLRPCLIAAPADRRPRA